MKVPRAPDVPLLLGQGGHAWLVLEHFVARGGGKGVFPIWGTPHDLAEEGKTCPIPGGGLVSS